MTQTATQIETYTISMTRDFNAPRSAVFEAWTDPEMLQRWFGPEGVTTPAVTVDLRPGGKFEFTMQEPNGNTINQGGEYREIDPPERLVFTWVLADQGCDGSKGLHAETLVTLVFEEIDGGTRLNLTHEFLPTEASRDAHGMGWEGCLDSLAKQFV